MGRLRATCVSASLLTALAVAVGSSGCYRDAIYVSGVPRLEEPALSATRGHLFWGLVNLSAEVDLRAVCPQGVARVERRRTVWNAALTLVTLGIYTPTDLEVFCHDVAGAAERVAR